MTVLDRGSFSARALTLPPDRSRLLEARNFAAAAASDFGFDATVRQEIRLATNEAVANAIEHGCSAPEDTVELEAVEEGGALAIYVLDSGRYTPLMLRRGSLPERGRGLAFMDRLMDELEVRPGEDGTQVRLVKRPS